MAEAKTVAIRVAVENVEAAIAALKGIGTVGEVEFRKLAAAADGVEPSFRRATDAVGGAAGRMAGSAGTAFGQLGYQVQDFVVQVQGGTGALTAFVQQGSQVAGAFGPIPALVAGVAAAVVGAGAAFLGLNREVEKTPELVGGFLGALDAVGAKAEEVRAKVGALPDELRRLAAGQAGIEVQGLDAQAQARAGQLTEQLAGRFRVQALAGIDVSDEGQIGQQASAALAAAGRQAKDAGARLAQAVATGDAEQVAALVNLMGLQNDAESTKLVNELLGIVGRRKIAEVVAKEGAKGGELGPGFVLAAAAPFVPVGGAGPPGFGPDDATRPSPVFKPRDEAALQAQLDREAAAAEQAARRRDQERERAAREAEADKQRQDATLERQNFVLDSQKEEIGGARALAAAKKTEAEAAGDLNAANDDGVKISQRVQRQIESERDVRQKSKVLSADQLVIYKEGARTLLDLADKIDAETAATERNRRAKADLIADAKVLADLDAQALTQIDPRQAFVDQQKGKLSSSATPELVAQVTSDAGKVFDAKEIADANARYADRQAEILLQPFKDVVSQVSQIGADTIDAYLSGADVKLGGFADSVAQTFSRAISGGISSILTAPLQQGLAALGPKLLESIQGGQGILGGLGQFATQNPVLTAGVGGFVGGSLLARFTGGNAQYGGLGGSLGAAAGTAFGGPIGGILGGLAGSALGGLFGQEQNLGNDRYEGRFGLLSGRSTPPQTSFSPENKRTVDQVLATSAQIVEGLQALGATVADTSLRLGAGNKTGLELDGRTYGSTEELVAAVVKIIGTSTTGLDERRQQVLSTTKATDAGSLFSDLDFAKQLGRLVDDAGPLKVQLQDLGDQLDATRLRAERLGLSTAGLSEAYARQAEAIKDTVRQQLGAFRDRDGAQLQAVKAIYDQYEQLRQAALQTGQSTKGLAAARDSRIEDVYQQAYAQLRAFGGGASPVAGQLDDLKARFDAAIATARDLGIATDDTTDAYRRQVREVRQGVARQIGAFANDNKLLSAFDDLTDRFEALRQAAYDVGRGVDDLDAAYGRQADRLEKDARAQLRQQEQGLVGQTRGLQGLFEGFLDPIRQALGPFGIGQVAAAPQAQVRGGLDLFRETLGKARGGDLQALQGIVGIGQQTIGAAREFGASGKDFANVFQEVNRGLVEVQSRLQDRQIEALRGIEAVQRDSLDEQVRLRKEAIEGVRAEIEQLRGDIRQLDERRVA